MTLALAGDTMLGRNVAEQIRRVGPRRLFAEEIRDIVGEADLFLLNLECCISDRGKRWPAFGKPFFFRAPPEAAETLAWLGVTDVTLANNHALDYGVEALEDTLDLLAAAGIRVVGAGRHVDEARRGEVVEVQGLRIAVLGVTDHPAEFGARIRRPGVAYADLRVDVPPWLTSRLAALRDDADLVLLTPHWGPNMVATPRPYVRAAAALLLAAGADVIAGHSAHVFHGVAGPVLYDLGDFIDDYRVEKRLHNDRGLLWLLTLGPDGPIRLQAVPLALDYCFTRPADRSEYAWVREHLRQACAAFGTDVRDDRDRLVIDVAAPSAKKGRRQVVGGEGL